ncbi:MAG TPA: beta/gamma crystallin-related protein [Casimicrobiaceae bacterium]|nr:beta/gamma crystallin-related protein [Casimicrobiaceae bacterium]
MKALPAAFAAMSSVLVVQQALAQVVFYDREGFRGRSYSVDRRIDNLDRSGYNDRASSAIVQRGEWVVCEDANFRGRCLTLRPGQYPSLRGMGMDRNISSIRPVHGRPEYTYAPPPPPGPSYPYYPHYGEKLYTADVIAVRAVLGPPGQQCWVERQQVTTNNAPNVPGAIIGGVIGGVLGHQIGGGRGNDVATALGAIGGAAVGANVNRGSQTYSQDVRRCAAVPGSAQPDYWDVTYVFRGKTHRAQLAFAPGATITVNSRGEPRV